MFDDDHASNSGSAYVFELTTGQQLFKLSASDAAVADHFGISVSMNSERGIVGPRFDDDDGFSAGAAFVFDVVPGQERFKLTDSEGAADRQFGIR